MVRRGSAGISWLLLRLARKRDQSAVSATAEGAVPTGIAASGRM